MITFGSLDLFKLNKNDSDSNNNKNTKDNNYIGLLMPLFEYDNDLGTYGFICINGYKIIIIKKLDTFVQETASEKILQQVLINIHIKLIYL